MLKYVSRFFYYLEKWCNENNVKIFYRKKNVQIIFACATKLVLKSGWRKPISRNDNWYSICGYLLGSGFNLWVVHSVNMATVGTNSDLGFACPVFSAPFLIFYFLYSVLILPLLNPNPISM